jgi:hypothetical protein
MEYAGVTFVNFAVTKVLDWQTLKDSHRLRSAPENIGC